MYKREETKPVFVGGVQIGGQKSVVIQSMTTADTRDVESTLAEIQRLHDVGCQIVRLAVINEDAVPSKKSRSALRCRWWPIFISTTSWR
jgi:(E)-4-hydroxy-3-methylbut-2-enyl-diphosphate synthase